MTNENERIVSSFEKNSRESVQAIIKTWNGQRLFDIRVFYRNEAGELKPTQKGLCLSLSKLSELRKAIEALEENISGEPA